MNIAGPYSSGEILGLCLVDDTANQDSKTPVDGLVMAVYVQPVCACLNSATITITTKGPPVETILAVATAAAGWYYPRVGVNLSSDGSAIADQYTPIPVAGFINVKIDDAVAGDYVNVWLLLD